MGQSKNHFSKKGLDRHRLTSSFIVYFGQTLHSYSNDNQAYCVGHGINGKGGYLG